MAKVAGFKEQKNIFFTIKTHYLSAIFAKV